MDERLDRIAQRIEAVLGEPAEGPLRRLSSGASRETFAFTARSRGPLVVQVQQPGTKLGETPPEPPLLRAAAAAGVPVPAVIAHGEDDPHVGGSWWIVESVPGTTDPTSILAGDGVPAADVLLDDIARVLAAIHRMPADPQLARPVDDPLGLLRTWHERLGEPHPVFELAFRRLAVTPPPSPARGTFVHGDFRMGNLMVGAHGVTGVLDWELAHLGDPAEDLGWLCVPAWRFGRPDRPAAGLGTRERLLDAYERHGGRHVDPETLRWWELLSTLRWGVMCVMQAFSHLSGAIASVEHAVIGRRTCEVEWDLLELLDPRAGQAGSEPEPEPAPEPSPSPATLHDRPTMVELLDAARTALGDNVLPRLEGRPAFETRVVMRALGMVRRELTHAPEHAARRADALSTLGVTDERELAAAIRDGAFDEREAELCRNLRTLVAAKLDVANPRYRPKESP